MEIVQRALSEDQTRHFYHDEFVKDQVESFKKIGALDLAGDGFVVDVGGGCGFFARSILLHGHPRVRVLDKDSYSIVNCKASGLRAEQADALSPPIEGNESVICFNLILHHLVGRSDAETLALQSQALRVWLRDGQRYIFVNEYIYESFLAGGLSGWLIWRITSSKVLSLFGRLASAVIPSLRANTFGVGVRFRTRLQWHRLFADLGLSEIGYLKGREESVSAARRLLLIKSCRRDSFLLCTAAGV
jgi:hypothetical protein